MHIGLLDWLIIGGYLAALAAVGVAAGLKVADTSQYFLGKRRFGKLLMMAQNFGVGTHAEMPVSLAGAVYSMGISAIWYQWKNLFAMPFYWIMAPVFRRIRRTTTAEMMADRYGAGMSAFYLLFAVVFFTINIASILKGAAKVLNEVFGGSVGVNHIVLGLAAVFILYSFIGGLVASVWSDLIQGSLIIVLSFLVIPLGWGVVGGLQGMKQTLPAFAFSLATPKEIGTWFIVMLTLNGLIGIMAQPHMMAAVSTGTNEYACRVGFFHGMLIKRLCTVGWAIVGLMVAVMVKRAIFGVHSLPDPEDAFGFACRQLLSPGFRGLLIASVMGASLASCSALMIDSGALFTQGIYRSRLGRGRSERHYLWVGRVSGLAAVLIAILYALFLIERVLYSFLLTETLATYMGISIVTGLVWRRANRWGAAASVVVALLTNFLLYHAKNERLDYWDPDIFLAALAAGIASLVVVSLLTAPEPEGRISVFFDQLEIPSDLPPPETAEPAEPAREAQGWVTRAPEAVFHARRQSAEGGRQLLMVNLLHLRRGACGASLLKAYRDDLKGLAMGAALSVGLVAGLWVLLKL
ncbi:MAG TPA: sodium:solute symporter family protein [Terriglobia bacterium]|nr:sodium:solute symporter family protein [Terriglobia bacterium]